MRIRQGILLAFLLLAPRLSAAQAIPTNGAGPALPRFYVDVNFLDYVDPLGGAKTFENYALTFGEVATFKATYPELSRAGRLPAYVGGGFMLSRSVAIGVSYGRFSRASVVGLSAEVPHPTFFNAMASDIGATRTALSRTQSAIDMSLAVMPVRSKRAEFRLIGGPSIFTLKADMVREVLYDQTFDSQGPQNIIAIMGASSREASGRALGFHAGLDVTYFFHRSVGVAGGVRYGRATVAVETEPLSNIRQRFLVGSTTAFLGFRVRLGRARWNE